MFEHCMYFNTAALTRRLESEWALAFKPFDLAPPQAFMLRAVLREPGLAISQLAAELSISKPTATRALDGLVAKGLVTREAAEHDARSSTVHPTAAAWAIEEAINAAAAATSARIKKRLGAARFDNFVTEVRAIHQDLR